MKNLKNNKNNKDKNIESLARAMREFDIIMIGAGAGLSTSAGFVYSGERFEKYFHDFGVKYGFQDMYSGGFYPYATEEEKWAYWSRNIFVNRYLDPPKPVYNILLDLIKNKDYFILTTNVDHCFQKAGFDKKRLFYTQGDYGLFQCSEPCRQETWDNENMIREMMEKQKDMRIPSDLIPRCPNCGKPVSMNLRVDNSFVEDAGWHIAAENYQKFLENHEDQAILFLELGVGYNTPGIIKYPFWRMVYKNQKAIYACVNYGEADAPSEIIDRSICINGDIGEILNKIREVI